MSYNDDSRKSAKEQHTEALKQFRSANPTLANLENFRLHRAKARRVVREAQRDYTSRSYEQPNFTEENLEHGQDSVASCKSPISQQLSISNAIDSMIDSPQDIAKTLGSTQSIVY